MKLFLLAVTIGLVSCQAIPGGVVQGDPKDPMFQKPARVAATYTDNQNPISLSAQYGPRYKVVAASTQVVAGVLYRMTLKFTSANNRVTLCDVEVLEQSWLQYIGLSGTPNCRAVQQQIVGGYVHVDCNLPEVQAAAAFAVDAMNKQSNSLFRNMLIKVVSAQRQVVAGMNYKLVLSVGVSSSCRNDGTTGLTLLNCPVDQRKQICEVIVWDQPWRTPRYELTSFQCQIRPGGVSKKDPSDPMFQKPAMVAANYTDNDNSVSLSARYGQNYEVVAASTQVVEGVLYKLTLKFTSADNTVTLCDVTVLEKTWQKHISLKGKPDCRTVNQQRIGGYQNVDSTSPAVKAAAAFAVDAMNKKSNSLYRNMLMEVVSAQQQVVAGMNYKLVLSVGVSSSCRNDGTTGLTLLNCPVDQPKQRCEVIVWDQPWRTPRYELTSFNCQ